MIYSTRRHIAGVILAAASMIPFDRVWGTAAALLTPLYLRLGRKVGWEEMMGRNHCVVSDLFVTQVGFPRTDPGRRICSALELPWRGNGKDISAIPAGIYGGSVRTDGALGWRIELHGTEPRTEIQVHVGNTPEDSVGCILLGTGASSDAECRIAGSRAALGLVKDEYGTNLARGVEFAIQEF